MKFLRKDYVDGDLRETRRFAFFPVTVLRSTIIDGKHHDETRWLEFVTVQQRFSGAVPFHQGGWVDYKFLDSTE